MKPKSSTTPDQSAPSKVIKDRSESGPCSALPTRTRHAFFFCAEASRRISVLGRSSRLGPMGLVVGKA